MSWQIRADQRSRALHREVAKKLRKNPDLWDIPKEKTDLRIMINDF